MRMILHIVPALMVAAVASEARAEPLAGAALKGVLVGNTIERPVTNASTGQAGTMSTFYDVDGNFYSKNSWGESGRGTYAISDDGENCIKWTAKHANWAAARDVCSKFEFTPPSTLKSSSGSLYSISKGNSAGAK